MTFYKKYKLLIKIALLLIVLVFIGQFLWQTDFELIGDYLKRMPYTYIGILILSFLAYFTATLSWKLCLGRERSKVNIGNLFMMRHVGEMLSVFNPASVVAGETLKVHYLKKIGVDSQISVSSILMTRILIILSAFLLMLISVLYLIVITFGTGKILVFVMLGAFILGVFGYFLARYLLHSKLYLSRSFKALQKRLGKKFITDELCVSVEEVNRTAHIFYNSNRWQFYQASMLSILHWILGAAEFYLILKVLGFDISLLNAIAIEMGVILFKTLGAIVPGQVGVEEYGNKIMLGVVGIASYEVWLVVSLMRRARQLFWVGIAAIFYWIIRKSQRTLLTE